MFISAVKLGIFAWGSLGIVLFFGASLKRPLEEMQFLAPRVGFFFPPKTLPFAGKQHK